MYLNTSADIVNKPILILDEEHEVISANQAFYSTFGSSSELVLQKSIFEIFGGAFNTAEMRACIDAVITESEYREGLPITLTSFLGNQQNLILNLQKMYSGEEKAPQKEYTVVHIENVTDMMSAARVVSDHIREVRLQNSIKVERLKASIKQLERGMKK